MLVLIRMSFLLCCFRSQSALALRAIARTPGREPPAVIAVPSDYIPAGNQLASQQSKMGTPSIRLKTDPSSRTAPDNTGKRCPCPDGSLDPDSALEMTERIVLLDLTCCVE
jgi:hypothetical protein